MLDIIFILFPGAITYLLAEMNNPDRFKYSHIGFIKWVLYSGIDLGIIWLYQNRVYGTSIITYDTSYLHIDFTGILFLISIIIALVTGIVLSFLKIVRVETRIVETGHGIFDNVNPKVRRVAKGMIVGIAFLGILTISLKPQLDGFIQGRAKAGFQKQCRTYLTEVQKQVADQTAQGETVSDLADLSIDSLIVTRVYADQSWSIPSKKGTAEAVYMTDSLGTVVYFSYRDTKYVATWSGATSDNEFKKSHNGWNSGRGYGWTGMGMK